MANWGVEIMWWVCFYGGVLVWGVSCWEESGMGGEGVEGGERREVEGWGIGSAEDVGVEGRVGDWAR